MSNKLRTFGLFILLLMAKNIQAQNKTAPQATNFPYCTHYQIFVRSFADANGDGIGDLKGITAKWDYLNGLGIESILLSPIFASPSYHKYDVTDYYKLDSEYGDTEWFESFIKDAHKHNIKVILDLPLNHCSKKHPWFIDAVKNPNSPYRDYFIWADTPGTDKEHWHQPKDAKGKYYYGYFSPDMPDLNYDNDSVVNEAIKIAAFWLKQKKVDGFRLDAAQHIFDDKKKTIAFWKKFKEACIEINPHVFLVGEVGNSFEVIGPYLQSSMSACFNFDLSSAILDMIKTETADGFNKKVQKIQSYYSLYNKNFFDATFITNHDQERVMSQLNDNADKAILAAALMFTLPGQPFIYYGEEIGMKGKKPDEHIREPMLFDEPKYDEMRPKWIKPIYSNDETVANVEKQKQEFASILSRYQQLILLRKGIAALTAGNFEPLQLNTNDAVGFFRTYNAQRCLVLHNVTSKEVTLVLSESEKNYTQSLYQTSKASTVANGKITLAPYSSIVLRQPVAK